MLLSTLSPMSLMTAALKWSMHFHIKSDHSWNST
ncbi:hypothetical protein WG66_014606 [Moniliophthora roreri]|nr:hypothetical protein WG66_014606 [Moniliophthora roreri]